MREWIKNLPIMRRRRLHKYYWKSLEESGEYELRELPKYVAKDRYAIDVGGNIGIYAYHLGRLSKGVIVFEPNPEYVQTLQDAGVAERLERVALSDKAGVAELRIPLREGAEDHGMGSLEAGAVPGEVLGRSFQVPLKRLDDYRFENIGFIKIDVEGHEEGVLRGALETIAREKPTFLIEIEERHNPGGLQRIRELLAGYNGYFFLDGQRHSLSEFDPAKHQRVSDLDSAIKDRRHSSYINNFLFVPA